MHSPTSKVKGFFIGQMINVDDRLLNELDESEMYLVLHIAKHMKASRMTAWPSLPTLAKACKWDERTVKTYRQSLIDKGFLHMEATPGKPTKYRFLKEGIGIYHGLNTDEQIAESEGAENVGGTKNDGAFFAGKGVQNLPPEVIKKEVVKQERGGEEKTLPLPNGNSTLEAEKEKEPTTPGGGSAGEPVTPPPPHRITLYERPNAATPVDLEKSLRRFYKDWPNEWAVGILEYGKGAKYPKERQAEIVKDFCCWAIDEGRGMDTYQRLNARLQLWFRNEQFTGWKKTAAQPSAAEYTPNPYKRKAQ